MSKYIKITKPDGTVSFAVSNKDLYTRLNFQNEQRSGNTKHKIEEVELSEKEVSEHSGYDEDAGIQLNPTSARLFDDNKAQADRIAELEAQLEAAKGEVKETKSKK